MILAVRSVRREQAETQKRGHVLATWPLFLCVGVVYGSDYPVQWHLSAFQNRFQCKR